MTEKVDDFLEHFGVLGMKWGVRKLENRVYANNAKKQATATAAKRKLSRTASVDHKTAAKLKVKPVHEMTNSELQTIINRMNLEQNFSRLNPSDFQIGLNHVNTALGVIGVATKVTNLGGKTIGDVRKSVDKVRSAHKIAKALNSVGSQIKPPMSQEEFSAQFKW